MTIPGGTTRAAQPKALAHDKHSHGVGGEKSMKKHGDGPHNWGSDNTELRDELAAQQDAQQDAKDAIAEGDERPPSESFTSRATAGTHYEAGNQGSLSDEFAEKEGALLTRQAIDPKNMDLKEVARTSGATSNPTGDAVSSAADLNLEAAADSIQRGKGTDGGFAGVQDSGDQRILDAAQTSKGV